MIEFISCAFRQPQKRSSKAGREDLESTSGHRSRTEAGICRAINHMLRLYSATMHPDNTDEAIIEAKGEVIAYSVETAHLFEEARTKTIAFQGNTLLKVDEQQRLRRLIKFMVGSVYLQLHERLAA